jgi:hypothetical protein
MDSHDIPLERVSSIPRVAIEKLASRWITTVEQLVALGGTDGGVKALATELGISEGETRALLQSARAALDPSAAAALEHPVDTSRYPLGARTPRQPTD